MDNITSLLFIQQYGQTPVYIAAEEGHSDIVQMLIQANADINQPNAVWINYL